MLQTEVKHATAKKKAAAYSNYAALVYNACVLRVDSAFTKWNLDKAYALAGKAYKLNPQPALSASAGAGALRPEEMPGSRGHAHGLAEHRISERRVRSIMRRPNFKGTAEAPKEEVMALLDKAVNVQKGTASAPYVLARDILVRHRRQLPQGLDYLTYDSLMNNNASADFYYTKYKSVR